MGTHPFRQQYFGPYPKIQNSAPYFFLAQVWGFWNGLSWDCRTETQIVDRLSRNRPFWPRAVPWRPADLRPAAKNYLYKVGLVLKISSRFFHSIKSLSTFRSGKSNRRTDRCTPSNQYMDGWNFLMPFLVPFSSLWYIGAIFTMTKNIFELN